MLFNGSDRLGFRVIRDQSEIEEKELKRTLQSLACGKLKILETTPQSVEIGAEDSFRVADQLADQRYKIRVNSIQVKETEEENQKVTESILQDRQYQIDAAIVRIMKLRKNLSHKLLISELTTQLRFSFKTSDVKKRIESLIEREYMDRSNADPGVSSVLESYRFCDCCSRSISTLPRLLCFPQ